MSEDGREIGQCTAYVNFDGTTNPPTIRDSMNVLGITDNGVGDYTINYETTMDNANYCVTSSCALTGDAGAGDDNSINFNPGIPTTTSVRGLTSYTDNIRDTKFVNVAIFGGVN